MSPSFGIEAIAGLIPIHLHLQKLRDRSQLRAYAVSHNHILRLLLDSRPNIHKNYHCLSLDLLTKCQCEMLKGPIVNMNNRFNEVFPSFDLLNFEFSSSSRIINTYTSHFFFHPFSKQGKDSLLSCLHQLDNLAVVFSENSLYTLVITDVSIRNNVATSIAHIYIYDKSVVKTLHYAVNITSMEAELFAIRCSIN